MSKWSEATFDRLRRSLASHGAARVGETAVVSQHVHITHALEPGCVRVVTSTDAGRVFYGRIRRGEILHVDIFHEVSEVDHRRVAHAVLDVIANGDDGIRLADEIDIQTGTGGGRVSGDLGYGTKDSLRKAHANHVHLAMRIRPQTLTLLLDIISAVEQEVMIQGLEIRKVDSVACERGGGQSSLDMSPYSGPSDSLLKQRGGEDEACQRSGESEQKNDGESEQSLYSDQLMDALDVAEDLGDLNDLRVLLNHVGKNSGDRSDDDSMMRWDRQNLLETLKARGMVRGDGQRMTLTDRGHALRKFVAEYHDEILRMLRRVARKAPRLQLKPETSRGQMSNLPGQRGKRTRLVVKRFDNGADELAVNETVIRSIIRSPETRTVDGDDLRYFLRRKQRRQDICLVIDASASMAGKRLRAARHLAHHLVLTSRGRVAVIVFQERSTKVICPFTRDRRLLERCISQMQAFGLTPLAGALADTLSYIKQAKTSNPLLLLITDGVPTIPRWSLNPLVDAIQAAKDISSRRLPFACIGLEPNRSFLDRLTRASGGNLYIVDELERDVLVAIARREQLFC